MLTAETYKKSRRSLMTAAIVDIPIAAAFTFIGILLFVYYQQDPAFKPQANADVFGSYILNVMPVGIRGLVLAGVFATAMGSLSAALNALATGAVNDWYIPYFSRHRTESHHVAAARVFTGVFALLMVVVAGLFAYAKVKDPSIRIIPVVLGIAGFIVGPMLGVFLVGMLTRNRGSDVGNIFAITFGLITTLYLGGIHVDFATLLGFPNLLKPPPIKIAFTWFPLIGALAVFVVGICFRTPANVLYDATRRAEEAATDDRPMAMRGGGGS
jgi:Na+/proline symporter